MNTTTRRLLASAGGACALAGLAVAAPASAAPAPAKASAAAPAAAASTYIKTCKAYIGTGYVQVTGRISPAFNSGFSTVHVTIANHAGRAATVDTDHVQDDLHVYRGPGGWKPNGGVWDWTPPQVRTGTGYVFVAVHSTTNLYQADSCGFGVYPARAAAATG